MLDLLFDLMHVVFQYLTAATILYWTIRLAIRHETARKKDSQKMA